VSTDVLWLTKHHGLGNDFLVLLDDAEATSTGLTLDGVRSLAVRLCDRRRGIGADGLLYGCLAGVASLAGAPQHDRMVLFNGAPQHDRMVLFNADGSRAEMSGNGIRCFAQAVADERGIEQGTLVIATDAGLRTVELWPTDDPDTVMASVSMGPVTDIDAPPTWGAVACDPLRPVAHLSLGNPHSVVAVDDVHTIDLAALGGDVPDVNLEIVQAGPTGDAVTMRVHERGAGITEACGTGACATAVAAARWGLVDADVTEITVHMDGGSAKVRLDTPSGEVTLVGPATLIATIHVALSSDTL
jgi:diaminopimelate epimerase